MAHTQLTHTGIHGLSRGTHIHTAYTHEHTQPFPWHTQLTHTGIHSLSHGTHIHTYVKLAPPVSYICTHTAYTHVYIRPLLWHTCAHTQLSYLCINKQDLGFLEKVKINKLEL